MNKRLHLLRLFEIKLVILINLLNLIVMKINNCIEANNYQIHHKFDSFICFYEMFSGSFL